MLQCEADLEIFWVVAIGEMRLFGWPTADAGTESHRRWQATWRSEQLLGHLHRAHGRLGDESGHVTLTHFEWHRPFYHPWRMAWSAPMSYPFELFACFLAAPLTALIAMAVVHVVGSEPHFAGLADAIAQLPVALMVLCGTRERARRRHARTLARCALVALVESMHYWHTALLVWEIWRSHHPDIDSAWGALSVTLLVLPTILMLPVYLVAMSSSSMELIDAAVVRAHPRGVAVAILLAAMHSELVSMLPWRTTSWAGFPTRNVLLCVVAMLLLQKGSVLVLSAHFIQVDPSAFGVYILVFSALSLVQVLIEKALLMSASARSKTMSTCVESTAAPGVESVEPVAPIESVEPVAPVEPVEPVVNVTIHSF